MNSDWAPCGIAIILFHSIQGKCCRVEGKFSSFWEQSAALNFSFFECPGGIGKFDNHMCSREKVISSGGCCALYCDFPWASFCSTCKLKKPENSCVLGREPENSYVTLMKHGFVQMYTFLDMYSETAWIVIICQWIRQNVQAREPLLYSEVEKLVTIICSFKISYRLTLKGK